MTTSQTAGLTELPLQELLDLIGGLLADDERDGEGERAGNLHQAMGELNARAARTLPTAPVACTCGEVFASADELDEHFWAVFVPADDKAADGQAHAELALDMAEASIQLYRQRIRREHPDAGAEEIEAEVQGWLMRRPGCRVRQPRPALKPSSDCVLW